MFLTADELRELTGYTFHCRQIDWLRSHSWKFEVTAQQRPRVARSYFENRLGAPSRAPAESLMPASPRPNFQALSQQKVR
ncbi:DUF4224 domain-containing protein [Massilia sp. TWR1-2-2]|uniref:DUF4224 domain-containing protein n=1 Tax=Massilia sp. TWR1-2-2 TaxID=2804584 RepID=UPI003CF3B9C6